MDIWLWLRQFRRLDHRHELRASWLLQRWRLASMRLHSVRDGLYERLGQLDHGMRLRGGGAPAAFAVATATTRRGKRHGGLAGLLPRLNLPDFER